MKLAAFLGHIHWLVLFAPALAGQEPKPFPFYNHRPYLQSLTSTSVLIATQSKLEVVARLQYGLDEGMELRIEEESPRRDHLFKLEGLTPGTTYHFRVSHIGDTVFARSTFRTLPGPGSTVSLAAIGDSGTESEAQFEVLAILERLEPVILVHTGDLVYPFGSPSNYHSKFFDVYRDFLRSTCIYPVLGNHDCLRSPDYWLYMFHLPANNPAKDESYYSFDAGDAHFAALSSCTDELPEDQLLWLDEDLAASHLTWKIVVLHHPIYSNAFHGGSAHIRDVLVPILERRGVDLVLSGHDHVYERSYSILGGVIRGAHQDPDYVSPEGILYVVTGGGGAPLYDFKPSPEAHLGAVFRSGHHALSLEITPERITGRAMGVDEELIDRFSITKPAPGPALRFRRGDTNEDGSVDVADVVGALGYLFAGLPPPCLAASDVNGSRSVELTDSIHLLNHLFIGGPSPVPPYPDCGSDEEADESGCKGSCD
ncbi:MAG TPA: metallophosphoesterase [Planctomycetota bacterium]|nr:metallophosphoesterase [Planctomycetota bacterium]